MVEARKDVKATVKSTAEAVKETEVKTEVKVEGEPVSSEKKEEAKAAPEKKTVQLKKAPHSKKSAAKAEVPVKEETPKAPAAKKASATSGKKTEPKATVHFQFNGKDLVAKDVLDQAIKAFKRSHRGVDIKTIELYIVANESAAYYVVNGEGNDDYKLIL